MTMRYSGFVMTNHVRFVVTEAQWNKMVDLWVTYKVYEPEQVKDVETYNALHEKEEDKVHIDDTSDANVGITTMGVYTFIEPDGRGHQ